MSRRCLSGIISPLAKQNEQTYRRKSAPEGQALTVFAPSAMALKSRHGAAAPAPACGPHRPPEGTLPSNSPLQFPLETARGPAPDPGNGPHRAVGDASPCPLFVVLADDPGACAPDPASGPIGPPEGIPRTPPKQPSRTASLGPSGGRLGDARALPQNGAYAPRCVQLAFYTAGRIRVPLFTKHLP